MREQVHIFVDKICSRYECSRHYRNLVYAVLVNNRGQVTEFFICPIPGCNYSKPNKRQLRSI